MVGLESLRLGLEFHKFDLQVRFCLCRNVKFRLWADPKFHVFLVSKNSRVQWFPGFCQNLTPGTIFDTFLWHVAHLNNPSSSLSKNAQSGWLKIRFWQIWRFQDSTHKWSQKVKKRKWMTSWHTNFWGGPQKNSKKPKKSQKNDPPKFHFFWPNLTNFDKFVKFQEFPKKCQIRQFGTCQLLGPVWQLLGSCQNLTPGFVNFWDHVKIWPQGLSTFWWHVETWHLDFDIFWDPMGNFDMTHGIVNSKFGNLAISSWLNFVIWSQVDHRWMIPQNDPPGFSFFEIGTRSKLDLLPNFLTTSWKYQRHLPIFSPKFKTKTRKLNPGRGGRRGTYLKHHPCAVSKLQSVKSKWKRRWVWSSFVTNEVWLKRKWTLT